MMRQKASAVLASLIIASMTMAPHWVCAQTAVPSASTLPSNGPITALTAPIDTSTAAAAVNSGTTVTGATPATTGAISAPGSAIISTAQQASMYTQTETQITVMQSQLASLQAPNVTVTPAITSQIAGLNTSISNCQTRASLLNPQNTAPITGNQLNTYHCP